MTPPLSFLRDRQLMQPFVEALRQLAIAGSGRQANWNDEHGWPELRRAIDAAVACDRSFYTPPIALEIDRQVRAAEIRGAVMMFLKRSRFRMDTEAGQPVDCEQLAARFFLDWYRGPVNVTQLIVLNGLDGPTHCELAKDAILVKLTPAYLRRFFVSDEDCDPLGPEDLLGLAALEITRPVDRVPTWPFTAMRPASELHVAHAGAPYLRYINLLRNEDIVGTLALYEQSDSWVDRPAMRGSALLRSWMLKFLLEDEKTWNQRTVATIRDGDEFRLFVEKMERGRKAAALTSDAADRALDDYGDACAFLSSVTMDAVREQDARQKALLALCRCLETTYDASLATPEGAARLATCAAALCYKRDSEQRRLRRALQEAFTLRARMLDDREWPDKEDLARAARTVREVAQVSLAMLLRLDGDRHALLATTGCVSIH